MTARNIVDGLRRREVWATQMCARNLLNWDRQKSGNITFDVPDRELKKLEIEFVKANPKPIEDMPAPASQPPSGRSTISNRHCRNRPKEF